MLTILAGFAAGLLHVFSGPDHLAAVAPLAVKNPRGSWITGFRWGLGHSAGVVFVGVVSLVLRGLISVEWISNSSDRIVGGLLIAIGAWSLRKALRIHSHEHAHGADTHEHLHAHLGTGGHVHTHAAFGIGTLHGLAGSSHFLGILPALALPSNFLAATYLLAFGAGTIAAMIFFAHTIGALAGRFAFAGSRAYRGIMFACSGAAFAVGALWLAGLSW